MNCEIVAPIVCSEHILCAAIWCDDGKCYLHQPVERGFVISGWRHSNCIHTLMALYGKRKADALFSKNKVAYGFLTSHNRFVSRSESKAEFGVIQSEDLY